MPSSTTVAVVPRESFSTMRRGLHDLTAALPPATRVLLIDAGSPAAVRRNLESVARAQDYGLVRCDHLLSPNRARNLALAHVDTEFVLFVDYDTSLVPGVLESLERCARENDASIVGPVYLEEIAGRTQVHMAGALNHVTEEAGRWLFVDRHEGRGLPTPETSSPRRTEQVEFHCMLVRTDVFGRLGALDEQLLSLREHSDLCLTVSEAGGTVWFDPGAAVSYRRPRYPTLADIRFCLVRWSDAWNRASIRRFDEKWRIGDDDPASEASIVWARAHRRFCYRPYLSVVSRALGSRRRDFYGWVDARAQRLAHHSYDASRKGPGGVRVVHAASWMTPGVHGA